MRDGRWLLGRGILLSFAIVTCGWAQVEIAPIKPLTLSLQPSEPESVYAPPAPARADEGINEGAVHFDLAVGYFTDYVYRGIEIFEPPGAEDRPNLQVDSKLSFDLGKLPHPFIEVFVNYADSDPVSTFQEIRPMLGVEWTIRPMILSAGQNTYIYPNRDQFATSEVWGKIQLDDSYFLHTDKPVLSPYIYAAYDYDNYNGWYMQAGVSHDFVIEDTGLTLTAEADVGYIRGFQLFEIRPGQKNTNGFQHYQLGLIANYSLNTLFNFPARYGEWSIQAFLYYTDGLSDDLRADTQVWGGTGILFKY
jgi:hypothetical protein